MHQTNHEMPVTIDPAADINILAHLGQEGAPDNGGPQDTEISTRHELPTTAGADILIYG